MSADSQFAFLRAEHLSEVGRYKDAEREVRGALASQPNDPFLHAMLAKYLYLQDKNRAALAEADEAIRLSPDEDLGYFFRALILLDDNRPKPALDAARRTVELNNESADNLGLLGRCCAQLNRWPEALDAAERGLALDPGHVRSAAVRADALRALGRPDEAGETLREQLTDDPENAELHANLGWHALRGGERAEAMVHFREALRLQPDMLYARQGLAAAMQARSPLYGWFFRFRLWLVDKPASWQWGLLAIAVLAPRVIRAASGGTPWGALLASAVNTLALAFWFIWGMLPAIGTVLLWSDRDGRRALNDEQRSAVKWFLPALLLAAAAAIASPVTGWLLMLMVVMPALVVGYAVPAVYSIPPGRRRRWMGAVAGATVLLAALPLLCTLLLLTIGAQRLPIHVSLAAFYVILHSLKIVLAAALLSIFADGIAKLIAGPQGTRATII